MTFVVTAREAGWRLDRLVADRLGCSQGEARRVLERGLVKLDGRAAKKGVLVAVGQTLELPEASVLDARPIAEPDVPWVELYVDDAIVAMAKEIGRPSHPLEPGERGTMANALVARYPECASASEDVREGGLVHRLDVATSGVLLAARTRVAWEKLRGAFSTGRCEKSYLAVVHGTPKMHGEIDLPLSHSGARKMRAGYFAGEAQAALTRYNVLLQQGPLALVRALSTTGRMHQIRAHFAAIGHPLYGDTLYGAPPALDLPHHFLHAEALTFPHPTTNAPTLIEAPLPVASAELLQRLGFPPLT